MLSSTDCFQVFEAPDPESHTGWNISPGRQQLISSLMILGAFIASSAAGMPYDLRLTERITAVIAY